MCRDMFVEAVCLLLCHLSMTERLRLFVIHSVCVCELFRVCFYIYVCLCLFVQMLIVRMSAVHAYLAVCWCACLYVCVCRFLVGVHVTSSKFAQMTHRAGTSG